MGQKTANSGNAEEVVRRNLLHGAERPVSFAQRMVQPSIALEYHVEFAVVIEICKIYK
jgi:hypothetical protein